MRLFFDIPHVNVNGEAENLCVELVASPEKEVGGSLEYENNPNAPYDKYIYWSCEKHGIKYKDKKYDEDKKKTIYRYIQDNWDSIEKEFVSEYLREHEE